jgi:hypothetical protein
VSDANSDPRCADTRAHRLGGRQPVSAAAISLGVAISL